MSAELGINYQTVLTLRHDLQANAEQLQPETPLPDDETETDEMFQSGYIAICEFRRNLKRISPDFIAALVTLHTFDP